MANPTVIKLQDGNVMPQLGLGVWQASNEEVITAIQKALEVGYRSIDTAAAYKNEEGVGKALKNASVNREELERRPQAPPRSPARQPEKTPA